MEKFTRDHLRVLDIDPFGCFLRLKNTSHDQSIDLSNIIIRQFHHDIQTDKELTLTIYKFEDQIRPLLRSGGVVTIYSKGSDQFQFNIEPYIFLGENIRRWLTNDDIQTELSLHQIVFHSYRFLPFSSSDVPTVFLHRSIDSRQCRTKSASYANRYSRFTFPYCLSNTNIANPHTSATVERNEESIPRNSCYQKNSIVKHFDSYPRRLTTAFQRMQSAKII